MASKIKKNFEIEIRGRLTKRDFERLTTLMSEDGRLVDRYKRFSVDLSPGFDPKTKTWLNSSKFDLRVKKSGSSEKISVKVGQFHLKRRKEIEVKLKNGEFLNAVLLLETIGFDKGMLYFWESWEFTYQGFEVKLSKYTDEYYTWEIESDNPNFTPHVLAKSLNLVPYGKHEYNQAINWENENIHKLYSYKLLEKLLKQF